MSDFKQRLLMTLPGTLRGAIAGVGTPNIAGGGPVDIARALGAGIDANQNHDLLTYNIGRARRQDDLAEQRNMLEMQRLQAEMEDRDLARELQRENINSLKAQREATADWRKQQGQAAQLQHQLALGKAGAYELPEQRTDNVSVGGVNLPFTIPVPAPKDAYAFNDPTSGRRIVVPRPQDKFEIDPETAKAIGVKPDEEGRFWIDKTALASLTRNKTDDPPKQDDTYWLNIQADPNASPELKARAKNYLSGREKLAQGMKINVNTGHGGAQQDYGTTPPGGDPLAKYPENIRALARQLVAYQIPLPSGFALARPDSPWNVALRAAAELDPNFDAKMYNSRRAVMQDFGSGKSAQAVTSFNTVIGHLGDLKKKIDALDNTAFPVVNRAANWMVSQVGDPRIKGFEIARQAVADELTRAFRVTGGTEEDVRGWKQQIDAAASPQQLNEAVNTALKLLGSRISALGQQFERGWGGPRSMRFLDEKSRNILRDIGTDPDRLDPLPSTHAATPETQIVAPSASASEVKVQRNSAGEYRHSLDGGKTWIPGKPKQ